MQYERGALTERLIVFFLAFTCPNIYPFSTKTETGSSENCFRIYRRNELTKILQEKRFNEKIKDQKRAV